jgi:2,5-furandicarboxylate decarboxylase 1
MSNDLRSYLESLRKAGPNFYREVAKPLSREYELGVLQLKLVTEGLFPTLMGHVTGCSIPIVSSVLASYPHAGMALGFSPEQVKPGKWAAIGKEYRRRITRRLPTRDYTGKPPVQEVIWKGKDADLTRLPIQRHAEGNPGPYLTVGMTVLRDPDTGILNVGIYRIQQADPRHLRLNIVATHHGERILKAYARRGEKAPVVTFVGHHPAYLMATGAGRHPADCSEFEIAGALMGEPVELTKCATIDLPVPAFAEMAIEGVIDTDVRGNEGPFSEGAGYYGEGNPQAYVKEVTAITMRHDAIYEDLHPIHNEHNVIGLLSRESNMVSEVEAAGVANGLAHLGPDGRVGKVLIYLSIHKTAQADVDKAAEGALKADPFSKVVIVVDEDIDVYDEGAVLWGLATRIQGSRVIDINTPDGPARGPLAGTFKLILDCTRPLDKPFSQVVTMPTKLVEKMKLEEWLKPAG